MARDEETKKKPIGPKRPRNRPRKRPIEELEEENEKKVLKISSSDSDVVIMESMARRTRGRKAE